MKINQIFNKHELSFIDDCKKMMNDDGDECLNDDDDILEYYYKNK